MISGITTGNSAFLAVIWQSTLFLIIGLIISFILRNHSARAHRILLLSIIASLFVPAMTILVKHLGLGIFEAKPDTIQVVEEVIEQEPVYETSFVPLLPLPADTSVEPQYSNFETPLLLETQEEIVEAKFSLSTYVRENWRLILLFSWITASLLLTLRLLVIFLLGVRLLNKAQPLESKRITNALQRAKEKLAIKKDIKLYGSRKIKSPVIWCWRIKPVLVIPKDADRFHERIDWTGVLCHELAHWKRRDHISGLIAELAACILPWQILLWLAKTRLINLSEHACDDWVIATGKTGTDYAESLLDMTPGGQMAFVPAVVRDKHGLAQRVQRILKDSCGNPKTGLLWAIMACFIACSIAVTVAFAQARPAKPEPVNDANDNNVTTSSENQLPSNINLLQQIFEIRNWDPNDMAAILNSIIKNRVSTDLSSSFQNDSITLIPYPEKKWIIARAPNEEMEFIEEWINKLDSEYLPHNFKKDFTSEIINPEQVIEKSYNLQYSSSSQIAQIIKPLLSDKGSIIAEDNTGVVIVRDKISVILQIEKIINDSDKENEPGTQQQIFVVGEKDPAQVAETLYRYLTFKLYNDKPVINHYETATISLIPVPDKNWIIARAPSSVLDFFENMLSRIESENTLDPEINNNLKFRPETFSFNKQDFSMNIAHLAEKLLSNEGYLSAEEYEDNSGTIDVIDKPEVIFEISKILNNLNNAPDPDTGYWIFALTNTQASDIVQSLHQILKNHTNNDEIIIVPDLGTNSIILKSPVEYKNLVNDWIAKLDREKSYLPESWDLYYDSGVQPDGSKILPTDMTDDLVSLEIFPRPLDVKDYSWKDERFDFRVYSLDGAGIGNLMVRSEPELKNANRKVFQPGTYFLQFERNIRDPNITYRTICDSFIIQMNKPGIYKLYFAPKFGYGEISGSAGGCYAVNFEQIDSGFPVRGDTYINREKEFRLDGLPNGKYLISAVDQQSNGNVVVSRSVVSIKDESKVTLDIAEPPKGNCSLSGSIFGKHNTYTVGNPANPTQSKGEWFVLLRGHGSGEVTTTNAYEAITMDSIYVIRGDKNIVQETPEKANFKIEGIAPREYNVTVIEKPNYQGVPIIRQQSRLLIISQGKNAVMNFDFRENKEPEVPSEPLINIQTSGLNIDAIKELLTQWTGKEVIASKEAKDLMIFIYSPEKITKSNAINLVYNAINSQGFVVEETEDTIYIKPSEKETFISLPGNGYDIERITKYLSEWTGKKVVPSEEAMGLTITVFLPHTSRTDAIELFYQAIRQQGFIVEETKDTIYIKPARDFRTSVQDTTFDYETISLSYIDVEEVALILKKIISETIPDKIVVQPIAQSKQLIIYGKKQYRNLILNLVKQIDIPSQKLQRKAFSVIYANPEEIKNKLEELFGVSVSYDQSSKTLSADAFIAVTFSSLKQIVVLAPEEKMKEIAKQIEEWDSPVFAP